MATTRIRCGIFTSLTVRQLSHTPTQRANFTSRSRWATYRPPAQPTRPPFNTPLKNPATLIWLPCGTQAYRSFPAHPCLPNQDYLPIHRGPPRPALHTLIPESCNEPTRFVPFRRYRGSQVRASVKSAGQRFQRSGQGHAPNRYRRSAVRRLSSALSGLDSFCMVVARFRFALVSSSQLFQVLTSRARFAHHSVSLRWSGYAVKFATRSRFRNLSFAVFCRFAPAQSSSPINKRSSSWHIFRQYQDTPVRLR